MSSLPVFELQQMPIVAGLHMLHKQFPCAQLDATRRQQLPIIHKRSPSVRIMISALVSVLELKSCDDGMLRKSCGSCWAQGCTYLSDRRGVFNFVLLRSPPNSLIRSAIIIGSLSMLSLLLAAIMAVPSVKGASFGADTSTETPSKSVKWTTCGDNFECANITVPLDYHNTTDKRTYGLAITRYMATDKKNRYVEGNIIHLNTYINGNR
jgi:hypothetical protein